MIQKSRDLHEQAIRGTSRRRLTNPKRQRGRAKLGRVSAPRQSAEASLSVTAAKRHPVPRAVWENPIMEMYSDQKSAEPVDPIEEMQLRTWARTHYLPPQKRNSKWHPVILDEMSRKDRGT